jgi:hypothetical protein
MGMGLAGAFAGLGLIALVAGFGLVWVGRSKEVFEGIEVMAPEMARQRETVN